MENNDRPIELSDEELDLVGGGLIFGNSLVAIDNVLNNLSALNNNHVSVAVDVLGGLAAARS